MTSLARQVTAAIAQSGPCTADSLLPLFPGLTRKQVHQAVRNARQCGYLDLVTGQKHKGYGGGSHPGIYVAAQDSEQPKEQPERVMSTPAVSSVWNLGGFGR